MNLLLSKILRVELHRVECTCLYHLTLSLVCTKCDIQKNCSDTFFILSNFYKFICTSCDYLGA